MNFFKKNILKIKSQTDENGVNFYINYFRIKLVDDFKILLMKKLMNNNSLAIINTEMKYNKNNKENKKVADELTDLFDRIGIKYKKIEVKKVQDRVIMGAVIKGNDKKDYKEYIIGFVIEAKKIENIKAIINKYNINYYINYDVYNDEELLYRFESKYSNEEELRAANNFDVFDDNFVKSIVIHSQSKDSKFVMDILDRLKVDMNLVWSCFLEKGLPQNIYLFWGSPFLYNFKKYVDNGNKKTYNLIVLNWIERN